MRFDLDAPQKTAQGAADQGIGGIEDLLGPLDAPLAPVAGGPTMLPVADIDEDPLQPRTEFDAAALRELADSIVQCGVLQAISVRQHPQNPFRWMLNIGARRLRACRLAGKTEIPAFVDTALDSYAQVIENEQRENLTALDLAMFIQRRMTAGESQADVARKLGKSRAYVTYATALIDAPDWLMTAYWEGRCRGTRELHTLRNLHRDQPAAVDGLLSSPESITRARLDASKALAERPQTTAQLPAKEKEMTENRAVIDENVHANTGKPAAQTDDPERIPRRTTNRIEAEFDGVVVELVINRLPSEDGTFFVLVPGGTVARVVQASRLRLLRIASA